MFVVFSKDTFLGDNVTEGEVTDSCAGGYEDVTGCRAANQPEQRSNEEWTDEGGEKIRTKKKKKKERKRIKRRNRRSNEHRCVGGGTVSAVKLIALTLMMSPDYTDYIGATPREDQPNIRKMLNEVTASVADLSDRLRNVAETWRQQQQQQRDS